MTGIFSKTTDSSFIESLGFTGMDFVILDQEHGPITNETLHNHVRAARTGGIKSIVRVKGVDANAIGSALDSGADGVQVPNISTADQAKRAVEAARFHPQGLRGVCRFVKAANYGSEKKETYFTQSNNKLLILQVEGKEGVENLEDILEVENFDVLFVGPYDLSQSLGMPGQIDHPEIQRTMRNIAQKAKQKGKILGTFSDTVKSAKELKNLGFEYLSFSVDINIFLEAVRELKVKISEN